MSPTARKRDWFPSIRGSKHLSEFTNVRLWTCTPIPMPGNHILQALLRHLQGTSRHSLRQTISEQIKTYLQLSLKIEPMLLNSHYILWRSSIRRYHSILLAIKLRVRSLSEPQKTLTNKFQSMRILIKTPRRYICITINFQIELKDPWDCSFTLVFSIPVILVLCWTLSGSSSAFDPDSAVQPLSTIPCYFSLT